MSCIRFNTPAQFAQLDALRADKKLSETAISQFLGPQFGESKIERLRLLAADKNPKIRESVALSYHVPIDEMWALAKDKNEGVRICVSRNETTPLEILRFLSNDKSSQVRSWIAVNFFTPQETLNFLSQDKSESVRMLVAWKADMSKEELTTAS